MSQSMAFHHGGPKVSKAVTHTLMNRFQGFKARPVLGGVATDTFKRAVYGKKIEALPSCTS